jgi:hypothetical protein
MRKSTTIYIFFFALVKIAKIRFHNKMKDFFNGLIEATLYLGSWKVDIEFCQNLIFP